MTEPSSLYEDTSHDPELINQTGSPQSTPIYNGSAASYANILSNSQNKIYPSTVPYSLTFNFSKFHFNDLKATVAEPIRLDTEFDKARNEIIKAFIPLGAISAQSKYPQRYIEIGFLTYEQRNMALNSTFNLGGIQLSPTITQDNQHTVITCKLQNVPATAEHGVGPTFEEHLKTFFSEFGIVITAAHLPLSPELPGIYSHNAIVKIIPHTNTLENPQIIPRKINVGNHVMLCDPDKAPPRCGRCKRIGHIKINCPRNNINMFKDSKPSSPVLNQTQNNQKPYTLLNQPDNEYNRYLNSSNQYASSAEQYANANLKKRQIQNPYNQLDNQKQNLTYSRTTSPNQIYQLIPQDPRENRNNISPNQINSNTNQNQVSPQNIINSPHDLPQVAQSSTHSSNTIQTSPKIKTNPLEIIQHHAENENPNKVKNIDDYCIT
ncbi:hypothetical protein CONCODRAFT_73698 [Conidiobolus coronatus NRRL 28638]|uniref:CCHC-type domain-containing protein n=1 Tax=Conidiobolus coronatus (strain ATCC 28846 / CBS 209.66 / NRRL 28638) TaxID=796925 RepID=A0A137NUX9_CONC2|nr:hypothetical protein CONCODRAFT_73698 [Conidiobolus coronatus NRRL 28638]|eukprot:KXN66414.1 hypothetical protein CONCODRAFT_73698 [Conidiobolus coronatus NRRL 28638]